MPSTINRNEPAQGSPMLSAELRDQYGRCANDIEALQAADANTFTTLSGLAARAGDLGGTPASTTVQGIQGRPVFNPPTIGTGHALVWNGTANQWEPSTVNPPGGPIAADAPNDGYAYVRRNNAWYSGGYFTNFVSAGSWLSMGTLFMASGSQLYAAPYGSVYIGGYGIQLSGWNTGIVINSNTTMNNANLEMRPGAGPNNGNLSLYGNGNFANGNLTINSTNPANGNLRLTGAANGQGNLTIANGNLQMNAASGYAYLYNLHCYEHSSFTNHVSIRPNTYSSWSTNSNFGAIVQLGGTEPGALLFQNWNYNGPSWAIQVGDWNQVPTGPSPGQNCPLNFYATQGYQWPFGQPNTSDHPAFWQGSSLTRAISLDVVPGGSPYVRFTSWGMSEKPGGGAFASVSDSRTKTDVHPYQHGLAQLTQLNPISYRYNGRARMRETGHSYVGLHAEEAQQYMPEMVKAIRGKLDYDEEDTDILHLDPSALPFAIINALKEIEKRLAALEAKLP